MKLASTMAGEWGTDRERIEKLTLTKFKYFDFNFWSLNESSPYMSEGWEGEIDAVAQHIRGCGLKAVQAHSPGGNPLLEKHSERLFNRTVRSIECCKILDIPNIVVHAGAYPGISREDFLSLNREFYRRLFPTAEKTGVNILIENIGTWQDPYFIHDGAELLTLVEYVNHPLVHACWDTGHGNVAEVDQYESIKALGPRLLGLHIHDNVGRFDVEHMPIRQDMHGMPLTGGVNFDAVIQGLLDINYQGYFTYEVNELRPVNRRDFIYNGQKVEKLLRAPHEIHNQLRNMLYSIGKFMLEQYDCFEE